MIKTDLLQSLQCTNCYKELFLYDNLKLHCRNCNNFFSIEDKIPSFYKSIIADQDWNEWNTDKILIQGNSYLKRAKGEMPEKEASKSFSNLINNSNLYEVGDKILDIGSACGHFYLSFHNRIDKNISYTGVDITYEFLKWGKEIFENHTNVDFVHCDALNLPFKRNSFDTVIVNLFHFFPNLLEALSESLRVTKKRIIWRTPIGKYNYAIKMISNNNFDEIGTITPNRNDYDHTLMMIYTLDYLEGLIHSLGAKIDFIKQDNDFSNFDNNSLSEFSLPATKSINGVQTHGNMILDWHYIVFSPLT